MTPRIAALVVTYFPDDGLTGRLNLLREQAGRLLIIDNGSDGDTLRALTKYAEHDGVTLHSNGANLGIATALNLGVATLANEGFDWVLTMDQDSEVAPGCVAALSTRVADDVALIGANRDDVGTYGASHRWVRSRRGFPGYERVTCEQIGAEGVTLVITSGSLTSVAAYKDLGPFRDDFFIDFVDSEYCLRARRRGYRIQVSCDAQILHRLGEKLVAPVAGVMLSPTHHSALRKYYLFRNGVVTIRAYGRNDPHWLTYQLLALLAVLVGIVAAEDHKGTKLWACAVGTWDGLRGKMGPARRAFSTR